MQLMKSDFHGLMEAEPKLREEIAAVAAERLRAGEWSNGDQGDMPDEELRDQPSPGK